ncbi:drug/metabolite transporter (DMT)-like permease [Actinophytocola oryzae]|uniref:Drug/metabolite transporter (DMT)-like permease n=1 Tax=Actinophytocola oryzae TaxID=502181 RepID=A0A4R7V542_9PSEU|nr:drug/metabolite transporter (DMT)-like permease [Actinophytocola oryzae]
MTVGLGRAVPAALLGAVCLLATRAVRPTRSQWRRLVLVAAGVVVGFPLCSALALRDTTSAHSAVLVGLLPAATAALAVLRGGERPRWPFWAACGFGVVTVLGFAMIQGAGQIRVADLWLLAAVGCAAMGYAEGGVLARELGGWQVISWALLIALPVTVAVTAVNLASGPWHSPDFHAWLGFAYVSVVSQFAGFYAWYRGLAEGGIAKISQLQLMQPVLTLVWSALLLSEEITPANTAGAVLVIAAVAVTQRTRDRVTAADPR